MIKSWMHVINSHVLINSDKHNVVYALLFHSSSILEAILHPAAWFKKSYLSTKTFFPVPREYKQVKIR